MKILMIVIVVIVDYKNRSMRKKKQTQQERIKALEKRQVILLKLVNDLYDKIMAQAPSQEEE